MMKMARDNLLVAVPTFFQCPISLDVMRSPVSLCTGVTYDRASIQRWLDNGNNTCPATMQPLDTKDFIPNHTLRRLIQTWDSSFRPSAVSPQQVLSLLRTLAATSSPPDALESLSRISHFLSEPENRKFLANARAVPALTGILSGSCSLEVAEAAVRVLSLILPDVERCDREMMDMNRTSVAPNALLMLLQKGDVDSRSDAARVLEALIYATAGEGEGWAFVEKEEVISELIRLMSSEAEASTICAGISCLNALSSRRRRTRSRIAQLGAAPVLGRLLARPGSGAGDLPEQALRLLEALSTCAEGRAAICEDATTCIPTVVRLLLKVPAASTEAAVGVLWSVCHLARDPRAQEAVTKAKGLTKILLVMQSSCSPAARRMCRELVKIFRVNSKSCLSSYDTKTTHIMPF